MFSLPLRILLFLIATYYAIHELTNGNQMGSLLLVAAGMFVLGYFRYGSIRPAFMAMQRRDLDTAKKHMATIKFPDLLSPQSRAYWHWTNAVIASQNSNSLEYAEEQTRLAIEGALRTSQDRCIATATLAQIVGENGELGRAMKILEDAEQIPHRESATEYLKQARAKIAEE